MLKRLPDIYIGRFFMKGAIRKNLANLAKIPKDEDFCIVKIKTYAQPSADLEEKAKWVANIPQVSNHTSWAAMERAVAIYSEEAAHFGWHFHVPIRGTSMEGYLYNRQEIELATIKAVDEFRVVVEEEAGREIEDLSDLGAKVRRRVYLYYAYRPELYALGVRVYKEK